MLDLTDFTPEMLRQLNDDPITQAVKAVMEKEKRIAWARTNLGLAARSAIHGIWMMPAVAFISQIVTGNTQQMMSITIGVYLVNLLASWMFELRWRNQLEK